MNARTPTNRDEWKRVRVGDTLRLVNGSAFKPTDWMPDGLPIVRIQNLNNPDAPFNRTTRVLPDKFRLRGGELLFAWSGTPGTSFGAHIWRGGEAWLNQHIFNVLFDENEWDKKFLQFAINQNLADYIQAAHGGAGLAHITKGRFEESELVQPSLPEQRRIVAEIEKQFTRLETAVAALRRVQANLKRYRAAVLKAACEGRLVSTEAAIAKDEGRTFESGEELLKRILADRRAAALSRRSERGGGKYKEPAAPDTANLPPLPEGWTWAALDQVLQNITDGDHQPPPKTQTGIPLLVIGNVSSGRFDFSNTRFVSREYKDALDDSRRPRTGDLLYTLVGSYGISLLVNTENEFVVQRHIAILRPHAKSPSRFLAHILNSPAVFRQATAVATGTAQKTVPLAGLRRIAIPLPPLAEQTRIVAEVERRLSVVEELESVVTANLQRATRLRQSILQKGFAGML